MLPAHDRGMRLNTSKYYVTFITNDGDTPRIVGAAMGGAWPNPKRGSVPVAWAVDLVLARQFPAWIEFLSTGATANDSFVAALSGAGYVFLNELSPVSAHALRLLCFKILTLSATRVVGTACAVFQQPKKKKKEKKKHAHTHTHPAPFPFAAISTSLPLVSCARVTDGLLHALCTHTIANPLGCKNPCRHN